MGIRIWGASTLQGFTEAIARTMSEPQTLGPRGPQFQLVQIHGAPAARREDEDLLEASASFEDRSKVYLIHRPDEILSNPRFVAFFDAVPSARFILLGDLLFREEFWRRRRHRCAVIPHPFLETSMPPVEGPPIVGAFTGWGEMRDVSHYLSLVEALRSRGEFRFWIGGSGLGTWRLPDDVQVMKEMFIPHFNVQLYHLHGRKRLGESSGSLHRGVTLPVIFEANGAERLESLRVIKIAADDDLRVIDFDAAANEIAFQANPATLREGLTWNQARALSHGPAAFLRRAAEFARSSEDPGADG